MNRFTQAIKQLIINTRKQWINEMVYGYRISGAQVWQYYGYQSREEFKDDITSDDLFIKPQR